MGIARLAGCSKEGGEGSFVVSFLPLAGRKGSFVVSFLPLAGRKGSFVVSFPSSRRGKHHFSLEREGEAVLFSL
jgi:hypothetical protein